jgi:type IV fimbrial biogenesis protein FimT
MDDAGHSGFTLIELLFCLAITALLAGVAVPSMARFMDNARLHAATESLSRQLRMARNHALYHRHPVSVSLAGTGTLWCIGWSDNGACDCRAEAPSAARCYSGSAPDRREHRLSSLDFPSIRLDMPRGARARTLRFSPLRGTATAATLRLANRSREMRVVLSPLGRVRICAPDGQGAPPC